MSRCCRHVIVQQSCYRLWRNFDAKFREKNRLTIVEFVMVVLAAGGPV